jgi:hypothetical protein
LKLPFGPEPFGHELDSTELIEVKAEWLKTELLAADGRNAGHGSRTPNPDKTFLPV